ncbi:MAG: hypothetical protein E4G97_04840 [Deltaproteobacteria bacterium]|nr:MAG: hypothetical protein E4G97_04840 [Deltaproteobacteria bacterium]
MTKTQFTGKKTGRTLYRFTMSEREFSNRNEQFEGRCILCGASRGECEPDARKYDCEKCGEPAVYGLEELLLMGYVRIGGATDKGARAAAL